MHIVYKITFLDRKESNTLPYMYLGSKSNCIYEQGKIKDSSGNLYYGSSSWEDYSSIVSNEKNILCEVLHEYNTYEECIQQEYIEQVKSDAVADPRFFNKSLATVSNYSNPDYATYKHSIKNKTVRLPRDHPKVTDGTYVGVTKGRSVINDNNHQNRNPGHGVNNHFYGMKHNVSTINAIKEKRSLQITSEETKLKMSETRKGVSKTEDHKQKIGRKGMIMLKNIITLQTIRIYKKDRIGYNSDEWMNPVKANKIIKERQNESS